MRVLHAMLPSLLCLGACQDTVAPRPEVRPTASVVSGDSVRLTYICGNTFRIRNANDAFVEVKWDIFNTPDSGRLVLPKRPTGTAFSQVFVTSARRGTMRVFVNGRLEETKANGNRPTCSTEGQETPWPDLFSSGETDFSKTLVVALPESTLYYRTDLAIGFVDTVSSTGQRAFLRLFGATVTGRSRSHMGIRLPDVGPDSAAFFSLLDRVRFDPRIDFAFPIVVLRGIRTSGRFPLDDPALHTNASAIDVAWWRTASRLNSAWGCVSLGYPAIAGRIAVLDMFNGAANADLRGTQHAWRPDTAQSVKITKPALLSYADHSAGVAGFVGAIGDNGIGSAGALWGIEMLRVQLAGRDSTFPNTWIFLDSVARLIEVSRPLVMSLSADVNLAETAKALRATRQETVDKIAKRLRDALRASPETQLVLSLGNSRFRGTPGEYISDDSATVLTAALISIRNDSLFASQVVLVAGANSDGKFAVSYFGAPSGGSNEIRGLTDIAAPSSQLLALNASGGVSAVSGTSFAAPQVAGAMAALLAADNSISPLRRKGLLLAGARAPRLDGATGSTVTPTPALGSAGDANAIWNLDVYGALVELSRSQPNMPICGGRLTFDAVGEIVVPRIPGDSANGGRALPLPSGYTIRPRGDLDMGRFADWGSVAQGGRRLTVNAVSAEGQPSLIEFNLGSAGWIASAPQPSAYRRVYLERDTAYWRFYFPTEFDVLPQGYIKRANGDSVAFDGATFRQNLPSTGAIGAFIGSLAFSPDGALVSAAYALGTGGCDPTAGTLVTTGVAVLDVRTNTVRDLHREPGANCASGGPVPWITNVAWHPSSRSLVRWTSFNAWEQPTSSQYVMQRMTRSSSNTFSSQGSAVASQSPIISEHMIFRGDGTAVIVDEWKLDEFQSPTPCVERAYPRLDVTITDRINCKARSEMPTLRAASAPARAATRPDLPRPLWQRPAPPATPNRHRGPPAQ
jgi:hypothetical protein